MIDELRGVIEFHSKDIDNLNYDMVAVGNVHRSLEDKINALRTKIESFEAEYWKVKINAEKQICEMEKFNETCLDDLQMRMSDMETTRDKLHDGEFVWKIENFTDKRLQAQNGIDIRIFSDDFYTHKNGYKMCLCVYPYGDGVGKGRYVAAFFHIKRGPFDDTLPWPFNKDVTLAVVNQQTGIDHCSYTTKCDQFPNHEYMKQPTTERNGGFGAYKLIKFVDLFDDATLYEHNRIIIKCTIHNH